MTKKRNTPRRQCKHCPWKKGSKRVAYEEEIE